MNGFIGDISVATPFVVGGEPQYVEGSLSVFFRGWISNRASVLESCGTLRRPADDAELACRAYRRWGRDLQRHVEGEFALVVVDRAGGDVLLTQDGIGVCPLFVGVLAGRLVFTSHLHRLLETGCPLALDEVYLAEQLRFCRHIGDRSPFRGIRRMTGGQTLEWKNGALRPHVAWSLAEVRPSGIGAGGELDEQFRALLADAVTSATTGERCWTELSGGLDSSSIACCAASLGIPVEAVSLTYPDSPSADERPWMRKVVERWPMPWRQIDGDGLAPFSKWPDAPFGEPNMSICTFAHSEALHRMAAEAGATVLLSGNGGDHVLLGDRVTPVFLADALLGGRFGALNTALAQWRAAGAPTRSWRFMMAETAVRPAIDSLFGRTIRPGQSLPAPSWLHPDLIRRHRLDDRRGGPAGLRDGTVGGQHYRERVREASVLLSMNVNQYRAAVPLRYPLLHRPLVAFMYGLPWEEKLRPGQDRVIQRRALKDILPPAVRRRVTKAGIEEPCMRGLKAGGARLVAELTEGSRLVHHGLVDQASWTRAAGLATRGMVEGLSLFMAAASLEIWLRQTEAAVFLQPKVSGTRRGV